MSQNIEYAFAAGVLGPSHLRVQRFTGREAMSKPYRFDVEVVAALPPAALEPLVLGQRGRFAIRSDGKVRSIHGVVAGISYGGPVKADREVYRYDLRLVPGLWLLTKRRGSRVFRDLPIDEVIDAVARGAGLGTRFELRAELPKRAYTTQFEETDEAFIRRLAAENGILFYFEQPRFEIDDALAEALGDASPLPALTGAAVDQLSELLPDAISAELHEKIVFTDQPRYPAMPAGGIVGDVMDAVTGSAPSLHFEVGGALTRGDDLTLASAVLKRRLRETAATYKEYDPRRPLAHLQASQRIGPEPSEALRRATTGLVSGDIGAAAGELGQLATEVLGVVRGYVEPHHLEDYEHEGRDLYPSWERGQEEPSRILRQRRRRAQIVMGESGCPRVAPGHRFRIEEHPVDGLNGEYVAVSVRHEGVASFRLTEGILGYRCAFECVPSEVAYVPPRPARRSVQVCLTATVIGPGGDDIHVNDRGEIQVRFHWERSTPTDGGTCWIRTMHAWAGAGWGTQFIPRVGMEVIVVFEGGDPDKPIVLGSVYNGVTPPPFALPAHKTISGFRTKSSPTGDGFNELSFEDAAGNERILMHAERDYDRVVKRDRSATIARDDRTEVAGHRAVVVQHTDTLEAADQKVLVRADSTTRVDGRRLVSVGGDATEEVAGARRSAVMGNDRTTVFGVKETVVHDDTTVRVLGGVAMLVGRDEARRSCTLAVEGPFTVSAAETLELLSHQDIVLRVGTSSLRITDSAIEIAAGEVTVRGKDARLLLKEGQGKVKVKDNFQVVSDDQIILKSSGASLGLKSEAKLDGSQVLLNSPSEASDTIETNDPPDTKIELTDQDGKPLAYTRFRIVLDGKKGEYTGFTDGEGKATVPIAASGKVTFPDHPDVESS
ncbi:MAG: type VI secretion system tip protein TssI/VgrG [Polyangiaceae bacterium]